MLASVLLTLVRVWSPQAAIVSRASRTLLGTVVLFGWVMTVVSLLIGLSGLFLQAYPENVKHVRRLLDRFRADTHSGWRSIAIRAAVSVTAVAILSVGVWWVHDIVVSWWLAGRSDLPGMIVYSSAAGETDVGPQWRSRNVFTIRPNKSGQAQHTVSPNELAPSLSGDGTSIAFEAHDATGVRRIFMRAYDNDWGDGGVTQIETGKTSSDQHPAWSPNGRYIVHESIPAKGGNKVIRLYDVEHQTDIQIASVAGKDCEDPAWSPDSKRIIYALDGGSQSELVIMDSRSHSVVDSMIDNSSLRQPAFSPDGKRIAYAVEDSQGNWSIGTARRDLTGRQTLNLLQNQVKMPRWSPDGKRLAYLGSENDQWRLFVRHKRTGETIRLTSQPTVGYCWFPKSNSAIASVFYQGSENLVDVEEGWGDVVISDNSRYQDSPILSPDGKTIVVNDSVWSALRGAFTYHLRVLTKDGEGRVAEPPGISESAWAAFIDDSTLMFAARGDSGWRLRRAKLAVSASGDAVVHARLADARDLGSDWPSAYYPSASHGKVAFMMQDAGAWSVYVGDPNKPLRVKRVFGPVTNSGMHPALSPNGRWVVLSSPGDRWSDSGQRLDDLYVVPASGGESQRLKGLESSGLGSFVCPSWSPDGRAIVCEVQPLDADSKKESRIHVLNVMYGLLQGDWSVVSDRDIAAGSTPSWSTAGECLVNVKSSD